MTQELRAHLRSTAVYALSGLVGFAGGCLLRLDRGLESNSALSYAMCFLSPFVVLLLTALLFVALTSLRHDLVAVVTGVACHFGALRDVYSVFLPLTIILFVGTALIGAAIGRDMRRMIKAAGQQ